MQSQKRYLFRCKYNRTSIFPPPVKLVLYRIAQEALNNVVKYAHAKQVTVRLVHDEVCTRTLHQDDGQGFDLHAYHTGLGLKIMRERAEAIGASLTHFFRSQCRELALG